MSHVMTPWQEASLDMFATSETIVVAAQTAQLDESAPADEAVDEEAEESEYRYNWEVLLDANMYMGDDTSRHAIFTRAYIDDNDLVNMGADDCLTQRIAELGIVDSAKRRKFLNKIRKLGYVTGFNRNVEHDRNIVDVRFKEYKPSFGRVMAQYSLQNQGGSPSSSSPAASPTLAADENGGTYSRSSSSSPVSGMEEIAPPTSSSKRVAKTAKTITTTEAPFDWDFDPKRDARLVAQDADRHMRNDQAVMKYWYQRFRLFSKLKDGILMDRESWFSVTPERLAEHIADRMVRRPRCVILDAFAGSGGNTIQFALSGSYVYAIDLDPVKMRCAARNATIYGVADRISFVCADFFRIAELLAAKKTAKYVTNKTATQKASDTAPVFRPLRIGPGQPLNVDEWANIDAVFLSPPWGGPAYLQARAFDLDRHMEPNSGTIIYETAKRVSDDICYFLPRNTNLDQIVNLDETVEVEQAVLNGKVKTISAYFGGLISEE